MARNTPTKEIASLHLRSSHFSTITQKITAMQPLQTIVIYPQPQGKAAFCAGSALFSPPILKIPFIYSIIFPITSCNPVHPSLLSFDFTVRRCENPPHLNCLFLFLHLACIWIRPPLVPPLPPLFPLMPCWH